MTLPKKVTLIEVGPRDGLQNERSFINTEQKIHFINELSKTGLTRIETTSFVSPKSIPQLADHELVFRAINKQPSVRYSVLVPNQQGMDAALELNVKEIAIFTAASETFNQHNIQCSIDESLKRFEPVMKAAKVHRISVRGYISCAFGCPYEGDIDPAKVTEVTQALLTLGVDEVCLGDTVGIASPLRTRKVLQSVMPLLSIEQLALHFHDTYGRALTNIWIGLEHGISRFDASVAGLGGCPYAKGATGNVASEDVVFLMHSLGIETGIDLDRLIQVGNEICHLLDKPNRSKIAQI